MSDNNKNNRRSPAPDLDALMRAYEQSLNDVTLGGKDIPTPEAKKPARKSSAIGELKSFVPEDYEPRSEATPEHDRIVDKIREDRRKRSHSVWTDEPVLKPKKSIWIDDGTAEIDSAAVRRAAKSDRTAGRTAPSARRADRDVIAPLPIMAEQPKEERRSVQSAGSGDTVVPLLDERPRKQELVLNVGAEGGTQVKPLPKRVNKKRITVDMSGYPERLVREESPDRRAVSADMPVGKMQPEEVEPAEEKPAEEASAEEVTESAPVEEEIAVRRTVALKMPISKINLDDLEPVIKEKKPEEKAEEASEEQAEEQPEEEETAEPEEENAPEEEISETEEEYASEEEDEDDEEKEASDDSEYNFSAMIKKVRTEKQGRVREEYDKGGVSEHTLITEKAQRHGVEPQYIMKPSKLGKRKKPKTHELEFRFINCIMCVGIVFTIFFSLLFMERESGFINSENRDLASFPTFSVDEYFSGRYTKGIDDYFTDTIAGREELKKFSAFYDSIKGIDLGGAKVSGTHKTAQKEILDEEKKATTTTVTANTAPNAVTTASGKVTTTAGEKEEVVDLPDDLDDGVLEGDVIVFGKGKNVRAVAGYYGLFGVTSEYAQTINKYKEAMPDVNVYNMTIPTSAAYYMPDNFKDTVASQRDNIDNITSELKGIITADVYDTLEEHSDEYIYARTDHHWQPLGAYYAGQVFANVAGVKYPKLDTYEKLVKEGFLGTMYAYSNYDSELEANPDVYTYYKPDNSYTTTYYNTDFTYGEVGSLFFDFAEGVNCYGTVLGRDEEITEIVTDVDNGRTLVIFKDSFGNALVPFLTHSFEKIYVCDFRYFDENAIEFCRNVGCTDLLFAISITSCSTEMHITAINNNRIQESVADRIKREQEEAESRAESEAAESQPDETQPVYDGNEPAYDGNEVPEYNDNELGG